MLISVSSCATRCIQNRRRHRDQIFVDFFLSFLLVLAVVVVSAAICCSGADSSPVGLLSLLLQLPLHLVGSAHLGLLQRQLLLPGVVQLLRSP